MAIVTRLATGEQWLIEPNDQPVPTIFVPTLREQACHCLQRGRSALVRADDDDFFVHVILPPPRLLIVGAVTISQILARCAAIVGFRVTVIDPRAPFRERPGFEDAILSADWPDEAIRALAPDASTAVVALAHDPKLDDPALAAALATHAFYVGALGSRRSHALRLERLAAMGCSPNALQRIHGPVGLPLGGRTAPEIAIAILAQIIQVRNRREDAGVPLSRHPPSDETDTRWHLLKGPFGVV